MNNFIANKETSLIEALKKIDSNRCKHLIVVDRIGKAIGVLSDGDIRRAILKKSKLTSNIKKIFNTKFHFFYNKSLVKQKALSYMTNNNISFAPILNSKKEPVDILTINSGIIKKNIITKKISSDTNVPVVIMAGGQGKRMQPFTSILPKPLIPIGNKTVIENILENFNDYNFKKFYITLNYKSRIIKSFLSDFRLKKYINYFIEKKPLGTIGSLKNLQTKLKKNFILTNADSIIDIDFHDFLEFHIKNNNDITIATAIKKFQIQYGSCQINNKGILKSINEKPKYNLMVNTGLYVIKSNVLNFITKNNKMDMDELLNKLLKKRKRVKIFPISEDSWKDVGQWDEYNKIKK